MIATKDKNQITPIGITNWRDTKQIFGIKTQDRLRHIYVIGKTGVGKTTLLMNMALADITQGRGVCIIDPHGDLIEEILHHIPKERSENVVYVNASDTAHPIAFNPLSGATKETQHLVASGLIAAFKKIWIDSWGPRLEYILQFALLTLLEHGDSTLLDIQRLLTDKDFREEILFSIKSNHIRQFWRNEFDKYPYALRVEAITPILNKVGMFITNEPLRLILQNKTGTIHIPTIVERNSILLCNLSKGAIGEEAASLLGSMLLTSLQQAALARNKQSEHERTAFFVYVDEMHSFVTLSFITLLAEARKYGIGLFLAHQYIEQLSEKIQAAVFGNVGTLISFRVGATDAAILAQEFYPVFSAEDLVNLPKYSMYLKLMIDGATSKPFSADTLPLPSYEHSYKQEIIAHSQKHYALPKEEVEKNLASNQQQHDRRTPRSLFE